MYKWEYLFLNRIELTLSPNSVPQVGGLGMLALNTFPSQQTYATRFIELHCLLLSIAVCCGVNRPASVNLLSGSQSLNGMQDSLAEHRLNSWEKKRKKIKNFLCDKKKEQESQKRSDTVTQKKKIGKVMTLTWFHKIIDKNCCKQ